MNSPNSITPLCLISNKSKIYKVHKLDAAQKEEKCHNGKWELNKEASIWQHHDQIELAVSANISKKLNSSIRVAIVQYKIQFISLRNRMKLP